MDLKVGVDLGHEVHDGEEGDNGETSIVGVYNEGGVRDYIDLEEVEEHEGDLDEVVDAEGDEHHLVTIVVRLAVVDHDGPKNAPSLDRVGAHQVDGWEHLLLRVVELPLGNHHHVR